MDLFDDNPNGDDDVARYGVFMHNKSTTTPNSTYLSSTVTSSSLNFIQTLLDETPANELTNFMSHPVYVDAQTTSVVHNPEGNPELTSYISGASEVPLGTHVDVLATKVLLQEMFPDENAHHIRSLPKLEALTNCNVSKAFEKPVQAKVLTKMKKLLPTHIPKAVANYVMPRLNTYVHELKLLNQIHESKPNMTHATNQKLYDTLYESICLNHDAFNAQYAEPSFYMMSYDNQVTSNNREGENKKKRRKDVGEPSSRSLWKNKYPMSGSAGAAKRKTTWFDLLLKSDIDQNENHILGPSTIAIAKKLKVIIQEDELTIADLEGARLEMLKQQYQNDVELEYHVSQLKATVLTEAKWNRDEDEV
ncbi:hypothetical protein Tco_1454261 [Tanacetum coccineum]